VTHDHGDPRSRAPSTAPTPTNARAHPPKFVGTATVSVSYHGPPPPPWPGRDGPTADAREYSGRVARAVRPSSRASKALNH